MLIYQMVIFKIIYLEVLRPVSCCVAAMACWTITTILGLFFKPFKSQLGESSILSSWPKVDLSFLNRTDSYLGMSFSAGCTNWVFFNIFRAKSWVLQVPQSGSELVNPFSLPSNSWAQTYQGLKLILTVWM